MSKLTEREVELLLYLRNGKWSTPMELGGTNGSHHSNTLAKLAKLGFVQFKQRGHADPPDGWNGESGRGGRGMQRGAKVYRITPAGRMQVKS